ncbi:MAG: LLM class flavin-dependent oxidoreductase [Acidimicrobiia bacterium]
MKLGIQFPDRPSSVPPAQHFDDVRRLLAHAQELGFTYFTMGQHFVYGDLRWLQPVPLIARLAADTGPDVRLAVTVLVVPAYHPIVLAEELATLDIVTEGRLIVGLGGGYRPDEFELLGVGIDDRIARFLETFEVMKELWTKDLVDWEGRFWQLKGAQPHIQPATKPYPPIWMGGHSRAAARRAGELADAWIIPPGSTLDEIRTGMALVAKGRAARGLPMVPQPLRRNVLVAEDLPAALRRYQAISQERFAQFASRGLQVVDADDVSDDFEQFALGHAILGTADQIVDQVRSLQAEMAFDPLIMKPQWTYMDVDQGIAELDLLAPEVIPALLEMEVGR